MGDGLDVWDALHRFYEAYVDLHYASEAEIAGDAALAEYWKFENTPHYARGLPALSKRALADQLTHACFWVTALHQVAGDVVQYVTVPDGMCFQIRPKTAMCDARQMVGA